MAQRKASWAHGQQHAFGPFLANRIATLLLAPLALFSALAAAVTTPDGVLIIHSNQRVTPAAVIIENTLRKVVPEAIPRPVEFVSEYLDVEWASSGEAAAAQAEFLRQKYHGRRIRVIIASAPQALQFATKFRDRMLPGVPVVHVAVATDQLGASLPADVIGTTVDLDPTSTLELALRLQPDAKRLVIVLGAAERDRIWERRLREAVRRLEQRVEVEYLLGLSTADVLRRLHALSRNSIVYTPGYFVDGAGHVTTPRQALELIGPASAAPVYVPLDTFLGTGVIGGYMTPYEEQAARAGAIVVGLLNGTPAAAIASSSIAKVPVVDWRALRRWGIDERLLPGDAIVRFREATAWEKYRREISVGVAVVVLQAVLISALLIERRSRRRIARTLQETRMRIDLAAHAARLSMWDWDIARDRVWTTARMRARGEPPDAPPTRIAQFLEAVHPADRDELRRAVQRAAASKQELDVEYRILGPDGEVRWIAARGRADTTDEQHVIGVTQDITARKIAELQAERDRATMTHMARVSMMGQVSASIAHQLNQPLAAILGNAEAARTMLGRDRVDLVELREICEDIVTEDNRAADVIRRLGALYKRGEMKVAPLDLNALVRETLDLLRTEMVTRHVAIANDLAATLPTINGGRVQLQQVLMNLLLNAADAMSSTPEPHRLLTVRTEAVAAEVRVCVIDRGPGIAPKNLMNMFDAFWSTKPGGMGMGLAICHSIVAAHRGTLTAVNNPEGGLTLCASLPVRPDEPVRLGGRSPSPR